MRLVLAAALFLGTLLPAASAHGEGPGAKRSKLVTTLLNAKWSSGPFVLEAAEFLAEESDLFFWEAVEFLVEKEADLGVMTDKDLYDGILSLSSRFLSWTQLNLLKFSLALRTKSPRIEMFQQIAQDRGVHEMLADKGAGCEGFVIDMRGKLVCRLQDLDFDAGGKGPGVSPNLFKVDHHYPHGKEESAEVVILYAEPGTTGFGRVHKVLKEKASRGLVDYVLRPFLKKRGSRKTRMSGYGVELQIKSSEYKAQDDRKVETNGESESEHDRDDEKEDSVGGLIFNRLNDLHPEDKEKLSELKQHLLDQSNDMAPMKVWQVQDLSVQAAERILNSPVDKQLRIMTDLAQNFPSHARSLSKTSVSKELKKEVKKNQEAFMMNMNLQTSDAALFINGMHFDMDYVDIFTILDTLKSEGKVLDGLGRLGVTDEQARKMISQDFSAGKQTYGMDIRDTAVNWVNDIEKDSIYQGWPDTVSELLRPTFPGMLRSIRKNFFNVVIMCDPSKKESRPLLKLLESFYVHRAPTRIGLVFTVNDDPTISGKVDPGVAIVNAYNYIAAKKTPYDALAFITDVYSKVEDEQDISVEAIQKQFLENYGADAKLNDIFSEDSEYDVGRQLAKDLAERSGFKKFPQVLMNGVPVLEKYLNAEDFEEGVMMSLMRVTNELQMAVYRNNLKDTDDVVDYLMKQPNIMPRLNDRILKSDDPKYIDLAGDVLPVLKAETFASLDKTSMASTLAEHMKYLTLKEDANKLTILTVWIVVDLESAQGREMLRGALSHIKTSSLLRIGVIHNSRVPGIVTKATKVAIQNLDNDSAKHLLAKILKDDIVSRLESGKKSLKDYDIPGADTVALAKKIASTGDDAFEIDRIFCHDVLELKEGENMILVNGKLIGPLDAGESFGIDDFNLLEKFTMSQYGEKMVNNYYSFMDLKVPKVSDQAMKAISLLLTRTEGKARKTIAFYGDKHSAIKIDPNMPDKPAFDITAIVDPLTLGAQKIAPLLQILSEVVNAKITVFLNCVEKHSEQPQKSYFRLVLEPELSFTAEGALSQGPMARFANLPEEPIFTMHYHIPDNWLVEPVKSVYDMDNIKLSLADGNVHSEYELEYLLLEGHCFETFTGNPPRGLQLTLGTEREPVTGDTIVMANLGYLQLKSNPGRWFLNLREGRSAELYDIASHEGTEEGEGKIQVMMDSFQSKIIKLKVQKKADKKNEDLLEGDSTSSSEGEGGLWNSITSTFGGSGGATPAPVASTNESSTEETLNIFCLASGHLYERLLKIMMLSTIRHTKAPVKFWILKSYLSPSIKEFLPEYARRYGFQYEYVQYKWPRWLNQQKEKQRIIWGYKILFLDVMFPLDVKKIIFVDTDQIVRADLTELRDIDLKGAPYGYTPFCDSNKDMEGFRFWKSGYWRNHLSGRPYHISALYVVDLVRLRRIAAGDRLRGQYQALSQDPNSLSNLDQDLPNNMIHQVPIFSLPQDWLWCETWCDQGSKKTAKSIDLCNNPLTKESKLDAARRIVAEWTDYDDEMQRLADEIRTGKNDSDSSTAKTGDDHSIVHTEL